MHSPRYREESHEAIRSWHQHVVFLLDQWLSDGYVDLMEVAMVLDYGPNRVSPTMKRTIEHISEAFENSKAEADKDCAEGKHMWQGNKCWWCKAPRFSIVEEEEK